jgi:hypothetical protein
MWRHVDGEITIDVSEERATYIFRVYPENKGITFFGDINRYLKTTRCHIPEDSILYIAVRISNPATEN